MLFLILLFSSRAVAQIPNQSLRYFAILTEGNLINNNSKLIKGDVGVYGNITGTNVNPDSVIGPNSIELSDALTEMYELKSYLNTEDGIQLTELNGELNAGIYTLSSNYETDENQSIKFLGSDTDIIIINVSGNLILNEFTNIILEGILPENIYWNIAGTLKIYSHSWVYGTFFTTGDVIINKDVEGAISTFSESNITLDATDVFTSVHYLTIKDEILSQLPCNFPCIESNLILNGDFSGAPNCSNSLNANGFYTDLLYVVPEPLRTCFNPFSMVGLYKIDNSLNGWNAQCVHTIGDHTANGSNLFFVDGFKDEKYNYNTGTSYTDTVNTIIWQQEVSNVQKGKEYLFYFWSTNINQSKKKDLKLRITFNGVEVPNTRYSIIGTDVRWRQHCIVWTSPGNIGEPDMNVVITIKQVDDFSSSGSGQDVVFDDFAFGKRGAIPVQITSAVTSNYCTGNNTTLSVVNPIAGYTYQWILNGINLTGAIGNTYVASTAGNYSVTGYSNQGCLLTSNIMPITISVLTGENTNVTVAGNNTQTWTLGANPFGNSTNTVWIKNSLIIPSGKNITIKGMRFEFGPEALVIVQAGATLKLEKNGSTPTIFTSYSCPNTMWKGIELYSSVSGKGILYIKDECIIENARVGVSNTTENEELKVEYSGYLVATGAIFRNNYIGVKLESKNSKFGFVAKSNASVISNCQFLTTDYLKDQTYPDRMHKTYIDLAYINGVRINGTIFKNTKHTSHPTSVNNVFDEAKVTRNKGITSISSTYIIGNQSSSNVFTNLWVGIDYSSGTTTQSNQSFLNSEFRSDAYGIILRGGIGIKVQYCKFNIDPAFTTGSTKVPKFFVGINARGSAGYDFSFNEFADGYCGIISKNAAVKKYDAVIKNNLFSDVGRRTKGSGQGIYALGQNQTVQIKCNTFISSNVNDLVQNHWVSDGLMSQQGECIQFEDKAPANNRFIGSNPFNADIYAKQVESGFDYCTQNTNVSVITPIFKEAGINMTSVYVKNCDYYYDEEKACNNSLELNIDLIRDEINFAVENQEDTMLSQLLYQAIKYYDEEDTSGQSSIEILNETPHSIAKWMLVAKYIQLEQYSDASNLLEILAVNTEEEQAEKSFYELLIQLENEDASLLALNQSAIDQLIELSETEFAVSYEAQGILHYLYGNAYYIPLPYEEQNERPIPNPDSTNWDISGISIYPNPTNKYINICNPSNREIQKVEIQNMNGLILLDVNQLKSNVINIETIENGIYFVVIYIETGERAIKKLFINK